MASMLLCGLNVAKNTNPTNVYYNPERIMSLSHKRNVSEAYVNIKVPEDIALVIVKIARSIKASNPALFDEGVGSENENNEAHKESQPDYPGDPFWSHADSGPCVRDEYHDNARGPRGPLGLKGRLAWMPYLVCIVLAVFGLLSLVGVFLNQSANRHHDTARTVIHSESAPPVVPPEPVQTTQAARPTQAEAQPSQPASTGSPLASDDRIEIVMGHATDNSHKMFVFTDPVCPYCKKTEPFLEKLSRDGYEIHLFPTPIHQASYPMINSLACYFTKQNIGPEQRVLAWENEINRGVLPVTDDNKCPDKDMMIDVNARAMRFFGQFGFNATPTLVNGHGVTHVGAFDNERDLMTFANQEK